MKFLHRFLLLSLTFGMLWTNSAAAKLCLGASTSAKTYSVYLIPRLPAVELFRYWAPFLQRLGKESGLCFDIVIPKTFPKFEDAIMRGKADFAFLNPYHQVMVHTSAGYIPLVRDEHSKLAGVIVLSKNSPIKTLEQLDGKDVAFPAPNAYVGSLLLRAMLAQKNIRITPHYLGSHSNVYRSVASGDIVAGGGANTTLNNESNSLRSELKVLFRSPYFVPHPFSAHPKIPPLIRERVIKAFLKIYDDENGRQMLKDIQMPKPTRANYIKDYQILETLKLENFVKLGK